jgi:hypothetical protein
MDEEQLELFKAEEVERSQGEGLKPDVGPEVEELQDEWRPLRVEPLRVELLKDYRGIYGVGIVGGEEYEQLRLITRPDRLIDPGWNYYALQPVPRPLFCRTIEGKLVDRLHRSMAARHGQIEREHGTWRSWSKAPDPKLAQQVYHGLKIKSLKIVNSLIRQALEVADQRALKATRRFPIRYRVQLYRSFCKHGERAIQLGGSFPLLTVMLFTDAWSPWDDNERRKFEEAQRENIDLVLRGAKLKLISDYIGLPYALRRVTPRATKYVRSIKSDDEIAKYIPLATRSQRVFFYATRIAREQRDPGFMLWAARQSAKMTKMREFTDIEDIGDWVRACGPKIPPPDWMEPFERGDRRAEFITRRFSPDMSLRTVRKLCQEWHEAIANNMTEGELVKFPAPWIEGADLNGHRVVPINDSIP